MDYSRLMNNIYGEQEKGGGWHQSSFVKQTFYYLIIASFQIGYNESDFFDKILSFTFSLTIATVCSLSENMNLIDMNGHSHDMHSGFAIKVLVLGWISFLLALVTNCVYYMIHPMAPQVNPKHKLETHIFGNLIPINDDKRDKDVESQDLRGENMHGSEDQDGQNLLLK